MSTLEDLQPHAFVRGILPDCLVTVVSVQWFGSEALELTYKNPSGRVANELLYRHDEARFAVVEQGRPWSFDGDGHLFRLVSEAHRIRLAHLFDPVLAVHTSLVDPLPHQITAVYEAMLPRQPLRFLLADDPGAGKTIMAGLLIKELMIRGDLQRCLVVCPGSLAEQWQDELFRRFQLPFAILTNDALEAARTGNWFLEHPLTIARLDKLARNEAVQQKLQAPDCRWDLVVCDEAHKLAATFFGGEIHYTKRYKLGQLLAPLTRHFLLMTATPHNGKDEDFQLFLALLDGDRFEGRFRDGMHQVEVSDLMRRMVKEHLPWNPNRLEQRFGRIHRIGQTEVCHLWNLVAEETREGEVYRTLLDKLDQARAALGGQVFDVLGKLQFAGRPLRDLLLEAIRYGERAEVRARLTQAIAGAVDRPRLQTLLDERALAHDAMDASRVARVREEMERAEARRLQPRYIESFFLEAFHQLGGTVRQREPRRYEVTQVPAPIRNRDRLIGMGEPVLPRYERIAFEKTLVAPQGQPLAAFVCPGHPLLDATLDLTLERHRDLLRRGTVLVDERDPGTAPRVLFYLEHALQDASRMSNGERRTVSKQLLYVELNAAGEPHHLRYAPYLDYRPLRPNELDIDALLAHPTCAWITRDLEQQAVAHAIAHVVPLHLQEVRGQRLGWIETTRAAVKDRLTKETGYWDHRAEDLKLQEQAGRTNARLNSQEARRRADELYTRLQKRMEQTEWRQPDHEENTHRGRPPAGGHHQGVGAGAMSCAPTSMGSDNRTLLLYRGRRMTTADVIQIMTDRIVRDFHPLQLILFGSHARGDARPDSDVDLLVVLPHVANKRMAAVAIRRALADLPVCKDIVVTTPEEITRRGDLIGTVLRPALREGKVLYERS